MATQSPAPDMTDQAVNDVAATNEDASININVLANDGANGQTKTLYSLAQTGTNVVTTATTKLGATVTINSDGTVRYDPTSAAAIQALAQGETATDSFLYTLETTTKSGAQSHLSQATVTVNLTGVNDPPVIHDSTANEPQTTTDTNPINPFSSVSVTDVDHGAQDSATITLTDANGNSTSANGTLTGAGLTMTSPGVYTLSATSPDNLSNELRQLVFTPTPHQAAAGQMITTDFKLAVSDGMATTTDTNTTVVTSETVPPNLLLNSSFETGDFTDWTTGGNPLSSGVAASGVFLGNYDSFGNYGSGSTNQVVHSGAEAAWYAGNEDNTFALSQVINVATPSLFDLGFFIAADGPGPSYGIGSADSIFIDGIGHGVGGNSAGSDIPGDGSYIKQSTTQYLSAGSHTITFSLNNSGTGSNAFSIDDAFVQQHVA